ncbi:hypothetical protein GCM10027051_08860 [Niabella terrae]
MKNKGLSAAINKGPISSRNMRRVFNILIPDQESVKPELFSQAFGRLVKKFCQLGHNHNKKNPPDKSEGSK